LPVTWHETPSGGIPDDATIATWVAEEIVLEEAERQAELDKESAKETDITTNLPSWSTVGGKFDTMLADANAATNLAQAKAVLIEVINVLRKSDRVTYWLAKNSKT